jgi:HK97 family phage prohead protease
MAKKKNKYTFLVSDESVNSYGFKVLTAGIDTTQFERNPVMLFMHDRSTQVIGRWENLRTEKDKLYADAVFDEADPEAKKIAGKVERGFIKAASIGITILEKEKNEVLKSELREISIVDIGSNKNALRLYDDKNQIVTLKLKRLNDMDLLSELIKILELPEDSKDSDVIKAVSDVLKRATDAESKIEQAEKETAEKLINLGISKGVINLKQKENYHNLFKSDFDNTKNIVEELVGSDSEDYSRNKMLADFITKIPKTGSKRNLNKDTKTGIDKPKNEWTLDDYRKYAPQELKADRKLYKALIKQEFGDVE